MIRIAKKGQVTIFVIIGIVLLIIVGLALFLFKPQELEMNLEPAQEGTYAFYLQSCIRTNMESTFEELVSRGFFLNAPSDALPVTYSGKSFNAPYFLKSGENKMPSVEDAEEAFSVMLLEKVNACAQSSGEIKNLYDEINYGSGNAETTFSEGKIVSTVDLAVEVVSGSTKSDIGPVSSEYSFDILPLFRLLNGFIENEMDNEGYVGVSYVSLLAYQNNFEYKGLIKDNSIVYIFDFTDLKKPVVLAFSIEYS